MIGLTSPNSEASATLAAQVITSIGALVLLVTLVAFVIALLKNGKWCVTTMKKSATVSF